MDEEVNEVVDGEQDEEDGGDDDDDDEGDAIKFTLVVTLPFVIVS